MLGPRFTSLMAAVNWGLGAGLSRVEWVTNQPLQVLFSDLNGPLACWMGISEKECLAMGQILGDRIVLTEFIGYLSLNNSRYWIHAVR